eukprot:CAMPEP_0173168520 /NCGR_PEP_ID=MMETSP1141-20130122/192_1 /TAXON_ID=483371 /ORGANISM="non described non described, Strain CCMP2298" /LENGTH=90 /DNA_ID=CAMNT_0014090241 /DNA_START=133 /DNA_END=406 /DNA_ORIENTATION=+
MPVVGGEVLAVTDLELPLLLLEADCWLMDVLTEWLDAEMELSLSGSPEIPDMSPFLPPLCSPARLARATASAASAIFLAATAFRYCLSTW